MTSILEMVGIGLIPGFILLDLLHRHRRYDATRFWRLRALAVTVFTFFLATAIVLFWGGLLADYSLFDASGLGIVGGAALGVFVYEFIHYGYHRAAHQSDFLWRLAHQMHHSTESLDAFGAHYLHPVDAFLFTTWRSLVFFPLLGVQPEAGALGAAFLTFNAMFQHANIRTPRWLGYLIQRPESHAVHHGRGIHRYNYADLPLWDMIFGTFRNPETAPGEVGFYKGASSRLLSMLFFRDVSRSADTGESRDTGMEPVSESPR